MPNIWLTMKKWGGAQTENVVVPHPPEIGDGWVPIQRGHKFPANAVSAGTTDKDGQVWVGRVNGEAGKVNAKDGAMWNFWANNAGGAETCEVYCTSEKHEWIVLSRGEPIPPNAVRSGETAADGTMYIGRSSGEPGKINEDKGKMWNFWGHTTKRHETAEILIIKADTSWDHKNTMSLGDEAKAKPLLNRVPQVKETSSVKTAVDLLNSGTVDMPGGVCIVYSANQKQYFALYRSDRLKEFMEIFGALNAPPSGTDLLLPAAVTQAPPAMTAADSLQQACPFASMAQIQAALDEVGGDEDLAIEAILSRAPSIKENPREWFHFFDADKSGSMDLQELSMAIAATLKVDESAEYVEELVMAWFNEFDTDASGHWDLDEFLAARDVILAALGVFDDDIDETDPEAMRKHMEEATLESQANAAIKQLKDGLAMCEGQTGGALAVYFCASMDLPGRPFTEILIERYDRYQKNKVPIEIMIVPMDSTEANFNANHQTWGEPPNEQSWLGETEWKNRGMWKQIAALLDVRSLPSLIILDGKANVITRNGVSSCAADEEGEHFPWADTDPKVAELHYDANPNALLNMNKLRKGLKFVVDDEDLAAQASKCPITVAGYDAVAKMASNIAMRVFVKRVAHAKGWTLTDERALGELVWEHSGARRSQSLHALIEDLAAADWVSKEALEVSIRKESAFRSEEAEGVEGAAATPAKGGAPAKGKAKGPGKGSPSSPADDDTVAVADGAPKGKGKSGAPAPPGKGGAKGKGGPPAAPAGAKGKGKGGIMDARNQPTREEKDEWVKKKKTKLWWKRQLQQQGAIENSVFQGGEVEVNMTEFTSVFEQSLQEKKVETVKVEKKILPPLWDGNDKQDPNKRRQEMSFLAVGGFKKCAKVMFERLENLKFEEIITDEDFRDDNFERLAAIAVTINANETKKLKDMTETAVTYMWDEHVEGFFATLVGIPKVAERLQWMRGHLECSTISKEMLEQLERIDTSINAIQSSAVFPLMCQKILAIGNCLDAGDAKLGRADGFDVIPLFKDTILKNMPKGNNDTSILKFLKTVELTDEERQQFQELKDQLSGWLIPKDDNDTADLGFFTNQSGVLTRELVKLEKSLQEERKASAQGAFMEKCLADHRRASSDIDAQLSTLKQNLKTLQKYLIYTPDKPPGGKDEDRNYLAAGLILGVINEFVKVMAAEEAKKRVPRISRPRRSLEGNPMGKTLSTVASVAEEAQQEAQQEASVAEEVHIRHCKK